MIKGGDIMEILSGLFAPYIFLSGEGVLVEGCVRIVSWDSERIVLIAHDKVCISGCDLKLDFKGNGACSVSGKIVSIELLPC